MRLIGVDEAGRGPVVGPMVLGAVVSDGNSTESFRELGVKDSKALTRKARERIFARLSDRFEIAYEIIPPSDMNVPGSNLNRLEFSALCRLVARLNPDKLIVDAFMRPPQLAGEMAKRFPKLEILAEWKADENHPVVSAASIVAKVVRDRQIDEIKTLVGDVGSGYPSDPKTTSWLRAQLLKNRLALHRLPACVRLRWRTVEHLREDCAPPGEEI